ncbi:hypothetical protein ABIA39_001082 [Nocardia sp. GAS34]|uniref:hypothetical protein n=1 Tax=unclassified Nocardia TaxID=2637762 RepID=UPI003D24B7F7
MPNQLLDDRVMFLLSQIGYHVSRRFTTRLAPLGLDPAHFGILSHLAAAGPPSVGYTDSAALQQSRR